MAHMEQRLSETMSKEDLYMAIRDRQITALMFHSQMADLFDFLGLKGFKRLHEYQYLSESMEYRKLCRYYINHNNKLLVGGHPGSPKVIPEDWGQYTRFDVTPQVRKQAVEKAFMDYRDWESGTKDLYSQCSIALMDLGYVADSTMICGMVKDVDLELKTLDRIFLRLRAVTFDPIETMDMQDELHEHYKEKIKDIGEEAP